jgi:hypothetical protein
MPSATSRKPVRPPQTLARIFKQMSQFLDWCVGEGELRAKPWETPKIKDRPEGMRRTVASVLAVMPEDGEVIVVDDASDPPAMLALREVTDPRMTLYVNPGPHGHLLPVMSRPVKLKRRF